ncbi:hypothetical protein HRW17_05120 [Streptomyces lunaelactis]|nr:hypothetical protein [Streptomyces lunaelactis]
MGRAVLHPIWWGGTLGVEWHRYRASNSSAMDAAASYAGWGTEEGRADLTRPLQPAEDGGFGAARVRPTRTQ